MTRQYGDEVVLAALIAFYAPGRVSNFGLAQFARMRAALAAAEAAKLIARIDADRKRIAELESRIAAALKLCDGVYWETGTWLTARDVRAALLREDDGKA